MNSKSIISKIRAAIIDTEFAGKTFLVGGYVRDQVMGKESDDIDIVVCLPNGGHKLAKFLHQKSVSSRPVIYDNFGTALVQIDNCKIEMVMTRKESYRDKNRKPEVELGSLEDDVFRRDFTVNSLLQDVVSGKILDITDKGKADIETGIIRSTSDPDIIFKEDPLRMLRAVRFAARFNFQIEENTRKGILRNSEMLQHISWERRRDELEKMIVEDDPTPALEMLVKFNLLQHIIPELLDLIGLEQGSKHNLDAWQHSLLVTRNCPKTVKLRIAGLLHDIAKPRKQTEDESGIHFYGHDIASAKMAKEILKRLKFSGEFISSVSQLIRFHMRLKYCGAEAEKLSGKALRKLMWQAGDNWADLLDLIHADNLSHALKYNLPQQIPIVKKKADAFQKEMKKNALPIDGKDIILYFKMKPGKEIGKLLDMATDMWLKNPDVSRDEILMKLERRVRHGK
ncbi:MAG: CCA tRNA nucleotidyltransferase [Candidatus Cloacimonetes bacterium]|nr:CCA tRNA nucleotidyltransferase [Candidatus Cloacimonadota bacterium]MCF7813359.1 CCA tRNA nucleotidyltransferase [Candidatus Cloacimonadota bacterium]MCF7867848.1 CCA tRNA nucleotidyltransferase [Candidatus Cloacimonadota bacterium]MCF7883266.1 CCA tRNA nucleotidyltransferase [Candidatus Cloacimonadota bacterium]